MSGNIFFKQLVLVLLFAVNAVCAFLPHESSWLHDGYADPNLFVSGQWFEFSFQSRVSFAVSIINIIGDLDVALWRLVHDLVFKPLCRFLNSVIELFHIHTK